MHYTYKMGILAGLTLATLAPVSRAQTATTDTSTTTTTTTTTNAAPTPSQAAGAPAPSGDTVQMEKYQVDDVPVEAQILPTSRPFASVFGTEDNVIDIPRNVTIISRAQMDTIDISDVTEFSKLTSSSYTDSNFGSPANPSIRGQSADVFLNGMRSFIGESGDGIPLDFNSIESINIIPGPATAVQGASPYVGGFVDLITKQPFFDAFRGSISYTYGSYNTNRWTLDAGGPVSKTLAYRFSYSGEDSDGYYYNWIRETTALYGAIDWRPNTNYELFADVRAYWADYRENFGINRPTEALIKDGEYQTGTNVNNGTAATAADPQNAANVESDNDINWGPVVKVDYRETAQGPASHAHGMQYNAQAIQTLHLSTDAKIVNNTMWAYVKRDTFNSDGYSEIIDPSWFVDNRTQFIITKATWEVNTGVELKYQSVRAYDDFFFEPVNVWDLSSVTYRKTLNSYLSPGAPGFLGVPVPGFEDRYATPALGTFGPGSGNGGGEYFNLNNDTNVSEGAFLSPFIQGTWKLGANLSLVAGARMDLIHVSSSDPLNPGAEASTALGEPNANVSLVYKITPTWSTYGTYNFSENYSGDLADGGGFAIYADGNGNPYIPRGLFAEESQLFEYGTKFQLLNEKLFVTSDVFYQTRESKPQGSAVEQYQYYGFELGFNYQPNKFFFATLNYSFINGSLPASADPFQGYSTQQIPGGPPDPDTSPLQTTGRYRAPGQPLHTLNLLGSYTFTNGIGLESNVLYTSPMNNDYQGYLVIPWQYSLDAAVFYKTKQWEFRLSGKNLTNQHNWEPSVSTYALEGIVPLPTITVYGTIKYKF